MLNKIDEYFAPEHTAHVTANRTLHGLGDFKAYLLSIIGAFSDVVLRVDHVCHLDDGQGRYRVATRWTMQGTHDGPGWYGKPTGKRINILGISHQEIENGRINREWLVFDEFALLKQLYRG